MIPMKIRVTQNDIARAAGVHNTTVSLALRNSPAIPEVTRKRIQAIAEGLGYSPDPALQALVAYRNGRSASRRQETIAYVTHWYTKWGWQDDQIQAKFHRGAERRAAAAGFQLEHFWLGEEGMSHRRLNSVLFHRGITGVILASHRPDVDERLDLDWTQLTAVKIGATPALPALHCVMDDHAGAVRHAMKRLLAGGYERIGLVLSHACDALCDRACSAAFLGEQGRFAVRHRVPPLIYGSVGEIRSAGDPPVARAQLDEWLRRYRPEVVVGVGPLPLNAFGALGRRIPRDLAYVDLALDQPDGTIAGIRENAEKVGEVAAELLIAQMQQNVRGIPDVATTTLVQGGWHEGDSLPSGTVAFGVSAPDQTNEEDAEKTLVATR